MNMNNKKNLRFAAKNIRKTLDIKTISTNLRAKIQAHKIYQTSKNIMLYYPKDDEINLLELIKDNKNFYLPRVCADKIGVCPYKQEDEIIKSEFGIMEPICDCIDANILDLIIVPALLVDKNHYRLGYGGGFYDKFLAENKNIKTLCAIPKELYVQELPHQNFDMKIDYIITT